MKYILKSGEQFIVDGYTSEGEHKVLNLLDTNTDDIATLKVVSHTKLQFLKNTQQLSPGTFYRIIDYKCTTTQENTQVGQGQFDIVVQAISESELNEKGHCIRHSGDSYFSDCNVESWEVNYSLDNNKSKYSWVDDEVIAICNDDGDDVNSWYKRRPELDEISGGTQYYAWDSIRNSEEDDPWMLRDIDKDDTFNIDSENNYENDCIYTTVNNPKQGQSIQEYSRSGSNFNLEGNYSYHVIQKGHGVIYWMKDEFGNECPYDFKHLKLLDSTNNDYAWTFNKPIINIDNPNNLPTKTVINAKIWVDHFWDPNDDSWQNKDYSESEIAEDYTLNRDGQVYDYTGNTVNYDDKTLYIWRFSADSEDKGSKNIGYLFTTSLDYSNTTVADRVSAYAAGSSEDAGDIYDNAESDNNMYKRLIYHGTYSEETTYDLESIVDDLSSITAEMNIDNFVDRNGEWSYDWSGPEDLEDVPEDGIGYYQFAHECVQYDGKILFLWQNTEYDIALFTTGLDYSGYTAVDQINPIYAFVYPDGFVTYDMDNDLGESKTMRSIVISASYSGPSIPKGNLFDPTGESNVEGIRQNLTSSIEYNIIPIKYNELGAQILDLTQIYYGPKKGYPYSKEEIDEAHKIIATALNEQKEKKAEKIELVPIEGAIIEQEIEPGKYYQFGTVSSLSITLAEGESGVLPKYQFIFTAASNSTQLDFPGTCRMGDNYSIQMTAGKTYEITIQGGIIRVESATFSS